MTSGSVRSRLSTALACLVCAAACHWAGPARATGANLARGKSYTMAPAPLYRDCADPGDVTQLTDGRRVEKKDGILWVQKGCVGWQTAVDETAEVIVDLEEVCAIDSVTVSTGANPNASAYLPNLVIAVSDDGEDFRVVGRVDKRRGLHRARVVYGAGNLRTRGRFVLVRFEGYGVFIFCDEIEIHRGTHAVEDATVPGETIARLVPPPRRDPARERLLHALHRLADHLARPAGGMDALRRTAESIRREVEAAGKPGDPDIRSFEERIADLQRRAAQRVFPEPRLAARWTSPWAHLSPGELPLVPVNPPETLRIVAGRNEYESAALVLANLSPEPREFRVRLDGGLADPGAWGGTITLRHVLFVRGRRVGQVADALPLVDDDAGIRLPPWQSRQLWLQVHTGAAAPGTFHGAVVVTESDGARTRAPLSVTVLPVRLPDDLPVATWSWQDIDRAPVLRGIEPAAVANLASHYTNVNFLGRGSLPWPEFDEAGRMVGTPDFSACDRMLDLCKPISGKGTTWFLVMRGRREALRKFQRFSPEWNRAFSELLRVWTEHLAARGMGYEDHFVYPYDEMIRGDFSRVGEVIRRADPALRIFANPMLTDSDELLERAVPYVDIWCPKLSDMPPRRRQVERMRKTGKTLWCYTVCGGKRSSAYRDFRLALWRAFRHGASGCGFWSYAHGGGGQDDNVWDDFNGRYGDDSVIYTARHAPPGVTDAEAIIPSKRWEAWREGIEDYTYLYILREEIARSREPARAADARAVLDGALTGVLDNPDDVTLAGEHHARVLAAIAELRRADR